MNTLRPTFVARNVEALTPLAATVCGVDAVALDVDGTLSNYHAAELEPSVQHTISELGRAGFELFIISNSYVTRAEQLAEIYGDFIPPSNIITPMSVAPEADEASSYRKPNPAMLLHAAEISHVDPARTLMVGDQILKDVVSANRAGAQSLLVPRRGTGDHPGVRLQRVPETFIRLGLRLPVSKSDFPETVSSV